MSENNLFKEIMSAIVAIFIMLAFIPVFQELGVNLSFIWFFVIAVVIAIIFAIISAIRDIF